MRVYSRLVAFIAASLRSIRVGRASADCLHARGRRCYRPRPRSLCGARRRGGRAAEGARLESVYAGNRIAGSNPAPSANLKPASARRWPTSWKNSACYQRFATKKCSPAPVPDRLHSPSLSAVWWGTNWGISSPMANSRLSRHLFERQSRGATAMGMDWTS